MKAVIQIKFRIQDYKIEPFVKEVEMKYLLGNLKYGLVGEKYESKNK